MGKARSAPPPRSSVVQVTSLTQPQARAVPRQRCLDEAWEQLTDALYTYCLSVLCDEDQAAAAMRQIRRLSVRHRRRLHRPGLLRAWLYALARYCCLLRMEQEAVAERRPERPSGGRHSAEHVRLSRLAWPEAAGTSPIQREALELTGRHGLDLEELAAVLDLRPEQAGALLTRATCELERTAAALVVLRLDACPELRRLGAGRGPVLGPALRGELVRHLDACPTCRGTVERAAAAGPWPGTLRTPGRLPLVQAPAQVQADTAGTGSVFAQLGRRERGFERGGFERSRERSRKRTAKDRATAAMPEPEPRFDRRGFPVQRSLPSQRAALLRQRAVATSVVAAVVAAPVVALWVTHHHRHVVPAYPVSAVSVDTPDPRPPAPGGGLPDPVPGAAAPTAAPTVAGAGVVATVAGGTASTGAGSAAPGGSSAAPGKLRVTAAEVGGRTVITLADTGGTAVNWQAVNTTPWLRLSRDQGTLQPGGQTTVLVTVDESQLPSTAWSAQLVVQPVGAVVTLQGPGTQRTGTPPSPPTGTPTSAPTAPPTRTPTPTPTPTTGPSSGSSAPPSGSPTPGPSTSPSAPAGSAGPSAGPSDPSTGTTAADRPRSGRHRRPAYA